MTTILTGPWRPSSCKGSAPNFDRSKKDKFRNRQSVLNYIFKGINLWYVLFYMLAWITIARALISQHCPSCGASDHLVMPVEPAIFFFGHCFIFWICRFFHPCALWRHLSHSPQPIKWLDNLNRQARRFFCLLCFISFPSSSLT
jgi:sterol desaturase/sphingolipid hydroxylase (fatty acid hydroxylase superfamily)